MGKTPKCVANVSSDTVWSTSLRTVTRPIASDRYLAGYRRCDFWPFTRESDENSVWHRACY